ncbi:hypothetical protein DFJ73DRAFT_823219 [Zopfochytrium polystomum]|nr:hypothetical protein DFJ73DRAFT_823219 [Zopfochytrium polystomum]
MLRSRLGVAPPPGRASQTAAPAAARSPIAFPRSLPQNLAQQAKLDPSIFADADSDDDDGDGDLEEVDHAGPAQNGKLARDGPYSDDEDNEPLNYLQQRKLMELRQLSDTSHTVPTPPSPPYATSSAPPPVSFSESTQAALFTSNNTTKVNSVTSESPATVIATQPSSFEGFPQTNKFSADDHDSIVSKPYQDSNIDDDPFDSGSETYSSASSHHGGNQPLSTHVGPTEPEALPSGSVMPPVTEIDPRPNVATAPATSSTLEKLKQRQDNANNVSIPSVSRLPKSADVDNVGTSQSLHHERASRKTTMSASPSVGASKVSTTVTALLPHTPQEAEDDFRAGRKLLQLVKTQSRRQQLETYTMAVKKLESAAIGGPHPEAMKLLAEVVYAPASPLCNAFKVSEWTKRRAAFLETPEGMMAQATFLFRSSVSSLDDRDEGANPLAAKAIAKFVPTESRKSPKDGECIVLIRRAADLNHPGAMHEFGVYLWEAGKGAEAIAWLVRAAETGKVSASETWLAEAFESGLPGLPRDEVIAAKWRAKANERKRIAAMERERKLVELQKDTERSREISAARTIEQRQLEEKSKLREAEAAIRIALDPQLRAAIRSVEWGYYSSGIEQIQHLASAQGNVDAQEYLDPDLSPLRPTKTGAVIMHHLGLHQASRADPIAAAKWFRRSAEAGYHEAMLTYAAYLIVGKGLDQADPGQAMAWLMKCWDAGRNKEAALALGEAYTKGIGVPPDPAKAVKWYTRAWETGKFPEAAFAVGLAYATGFTPGAVDPSKWTETTVGIPSGGIVNEVLVGRTVSSTNKTSGSPNQSPTRQPSPALSDQSGGVPPELSPFSPRQMEGEEGIPSSVDSTDRKRRDLPSLSHSSSTPSLKHNSSSSQSLPGRHGSSSSTVRTLLNDSSKAVAPSYAGRTMVKGLMAVTQDVWRAAFWYKRAVDQGNHARACNNLGELYMTGRGVVRDDVVGFNLFKRAASAGLAEAEYNVGRCYREGRGCSRDEELAIGWFRKAEAKGITEATVALASSPLLLKN